MAAQSCSQFAEEVILRLARRQEGVVSREQLLGAGVTRNQIALRLKQGRLVEIHRGVYLVGAVPSEHAYPMAALLACGPDATLAHRSAASLWRLLPYPATAPPWITIPSERYAQRPRMQISRASIQPRDIRTRGRLRVTSPPRTVLDMAALLDGYELEALVAEANFRKLAREHELRDQVERYPKRRGVTALRNVLDLPGGPMRTRSAGERVLLRLLREHDITDFATNQDVLGHEVDFLWRETRLIVELDGWDGHSGRIAFERDRLKWARLGAAGFGVMPVTGRQIRDDPEGVIDRITAALGFA